MKRVKTDESDAATLAEMIRIRVGQSERYTLITPEAVDAGRFSSCGVRQSGQVACWGALTFDELQYR